MGDLNADTSTKIAILDSTLELIDTGKVVPETVSGIYQALGEIAWMIEGCEADSLIISQAGWNVNRELFDLYHKYTSKLDDLVEVVRGESFRLASEQYILSHGGFVGEPSGRTVVWMLEGIYPQHRLGRVISLYLSGSQIKSQNAQYLVERSLVDPSFLRADLVVETPVEVLETLTKWNLTRAVGQTLDQVELDYLCGLWLGRGGRTEFEASVRRARMLARYSRRKI